MIVKAALAIAAVDAPAARRWQVVVFMAVRTCVEIGATIVGTMAQPPSPCAGPLAARNFQVATLPPPLRLLLLLLSAALDCNALALRLS